MAKMKRKSEPKAKRKPPGRKARLTPKQAGFAECIVIKGMTATDAAIAMGYSERSAAQQGYALLHNALVGKEVERLKAARSMRALVTRDRWLEEVARCAFPDNTKLFEEDGSLKRFKDMDEDARRTIASLEVAEIFSGTGDDRQAIGLLKKVKCVDKLAALALLGKAEGYVVEKREVSGTIRLEQLVAGEAGDE